MLGGGEQLALEKLISCFCQIHIAFLQGHMCVEWCTECSSAVQSGVTLHRAVAGPSLAIQKWGGGGCKGWWRAGRVRGHKSQKTHVNADI